MKTIRKRNHGIKTWINLFPFNYTDKTSEKIGKLFKQVGYIPAYKSYKCPNTANKQTNKNPKTSKGDNIITSLTLPETMTC